MLLSSCYISLVTVLDAEELLHGLGTQLMLIELSLHRAASTELLAALLLETGATVV